MRLKSTIHSKNFEKISPSPMVCFGRAPLLFMDTRRRCTYICAHTLIYTQQTTNVSAVVLAPLIERLAYTC